MKNRPKTNEDKVCIVGDKETRIMKNIPGNRVISLEKRFFITSLFIKTASKKTMKIAIIEYKIGLFGSMSIRVV